MKKVDVDAVNRFAYNFLMCTCDAPLKDLFFCSKCEMLKKVTIDSPFHLFGLEESFFLDLISLQKTYLMLQNKLHPDRFSRSSQEKDVAQDWSAQVNWAYQILKNPLQRAEILLKNCKDSFDQGDLLEHMEKREHLETLSSERDLSLFEDTIKRERDVIEKEMMMAFQEKRFTKAKHSLRHLTYLDRLITEIHRKQNKS